MEDWGRKPKDCWQDIDKKLFNPVIDWGRKPTEESDMGKWIDSIGAKIAQFFMGMQAIQRCKNSVLFYAFYSLGYLGN